MKALHLAAILAVLCVYATVVSADVCSGPEDCTGPTRIYFDGDSCNPSNATNFYEEATGAEVGGCVSRPPWWVKYTCTPNGDYIRAQYDDEHCTKFARATQFPTNKCFGYGDKATVFVCNVNDSFTETLSHRTGNNSLPTFDAPSQTQCDGECPASAILTTSYYSDASCADNSLSNSFYLNETENYAFDQCMWFSAFQFNGKLSCDGEYFTYTYYQYNCEGEPISREVLNATCVTDYNLRRLLNRDHLEQFKGSGVPLTYRTLRCPHNTPVTPPLAPVTPSAPSAPSTPSDTPIVPSAPSDTPVAAPTSEAPAPTGSASRVGASILLLSAAVFAAILF